MYTFVEKPYIKEIFTLGTSHENNSSSLMSSLSPNFEKIQIRENLYRGNLRTSYLLREVGFPYAV